MRLEAMADDCNQIVELPMTTVESILRVDWSPLLPLLQDATLSVPRRAALFHNSMAEAIVRQVQVLREQYPFDAVGLTGGVFQNRRLSEAVVDKLTALGIAVYLPTGVPCNDGGLCYGQVIEWLALSHST